LLMQTIILAIPDRACPSPVDIHTQLERIISSPEFPGAGRCATFLRYVTEEVIQGRAKRIKGYSIAIEVFNREEGFTQEDPVVRIEAGRLRRALERYYLVAGQNDPVRIDIAKGGYVPTFTWTAPLSTQDLNAASEAGLEPFPMPEEPVQRGDLKQAVAFPNLRRRHMAAAMLILVAIVGVAFYASTHLETGILPKMSQRSVPEGPTVVVAPFADLGGGTGSAFYATGLTEELLSALPRFKEIKVFGRETSEALPFDVNPQHVIRIGARYLVNGGVRLSGNQVRVTARLIDTETGTILWSHTYDDELQPSNLVSIQVAVADQIATTIAQPYGVIAQASTADLPPNDLEAYACTLRFYTYHAELSAERHAVVRDCLEKAVSQYPSYATAWAMLSMVYLDEDRFKYNPKIGSPSALERALQSARRAVQIDPDNTRGMQALMTALFFNGQPAESIRVGEQALSINPNDTELLSEFGTRLAMSGQWQRGSSVLKGALVRNPGGAGYYHGILALAEYIQQNYESASDEIRKADLQKFPLFHVVAAVIFAERGMTEDTARERSIVASTGAAFFANIRGELQKRLARPEDRARILQGLRKAGLVPDTDAVADNAKSN
jgi:adenylate cyclase